MNYFTRRSVENRVADKLRVRYSRINKKYSQQVGIRYLTVMIAETFPSRKRYPVTKIKGHQVTLKGDLDKGYSARLGEVINK